MDEIVKDFSNAMHAKFEQSVIEACMRKGFILNEATAPDFNAVTFKDTTTLYYTATLTPICMYSATPTIKIDGDKVISEFKFQEL